MRADESYFTKWDCTVPETESMTIDISEEVADEINEFVENEDGKESEEIETN